MSVKAQRKQSLLLTLLVAAVMAVGVLMVAAPSAHSQESAQECAPFEGLLVCLEKSVPTVVTVGDPVTFTITTFCESEFGGCLFTNPSGVEDTLPPDVQFVSAEASGLLPAECVEREGTVTCSPESHDQDTPFVAEIVVIPTRCGTFTNTAREITSAFAPNTVSVDFTVVGCEEEPPAPAPVTQETEQEAESGDIDQSFEVTTTGDNSNQCAGVQGVTNTGNPQNVIDLLQYASTSDVFEFEEVGSDITVSPESSATCDQQVNQAASASG